MNIDDLIGRVAGRLGEVADSRTVVGEPLVLGEVTLVPVSRVSLGLGGGGGEGEGPSPSRGGRAKGPVSGKGLGLGSGGAAKVAPVAVIAFTPAGVQVLPVPAKQSGLERLMEKVPEWIEKAAERKAGG